MLTSMGSCPEKTIQKDTNAVRSIVAMWSAIAAAAIARASRG
jgi:hypothetical protein